MFLKTLIIFILLLGPTFLAAVIINLLYKSQNKKSSLASLEEQPLELKIIVLSIFAVAFYIGVQLTIMFAKRYK